MRMGPHKHLLLVTHGPVVSGSSIPQVVRSPQTRLLLHSVLLPWFFFFIWSGRWRAHMPFWSFLASDEFIDGSHLIPHYTRHIVYGRNELVELPLQCGFSSWGRASSLCRWGSASSGLILFAKSIPFRDVIHPGSVILILSSSGWGFIMLHPPISTLLSRRLLSPDALSGIVIVNCRSHSQVGQIQALIPLKDPRQSQVQISQLIIKYNQIYTHVWNRTSKSCKYKPRMPTSYLSN